MKADKGTITITNHEGRERKVSFNFFFRATIKNLEGKMFASIFFIKYSNKISKYTVVLMLDYNTSDHNTYKGIIKNRRAELFSRGEKIVIEKSNTRIKVSDINFNNQ